MAIFIDKGKIAWYNCVSNIKEDYMKALAGKFICKVEDSMRVRIPSRFQATLGEAIYILPGKRNSLMLLSEEEGDKLFDGDFEGFSYLDYTTPANEADAKDAAADYIANNIACVDVDKQGRLVLSDTVTDACQSLKGANEVVMVGYKNYVRVWEAKTYDEEFGTYRTQSLEDMIASLRKTIGNA